MLPLSKVEIEAKATRLVARPRIISLWLCVCTWWQEERCWIGVSAFYRWESTILQVLHQNTKAKRLIILPDVFCIDCRPESIESFIEDQASPPSYDFVHSPLQPPSLSRQKVRQATHRKTNSLLAGEMVEGVGGEAKLYDGEKAWSSINHSINTLFCRLCYVHCANNHACVGVQAISNTPYKAVILSYNMTYVHTVTQT